MSGKGQGKTRPQEKRLMVYFREYCDYTGIHGFRYIGEDRTLAERIWWTIWLLLSMIFCGLMVYQIFDKYINYPVLITFSMKETRLQQIPFPAVTICPRAKFSLSHFNITAVLEKMKADNITEEEFNLPDFHSTSQIQHWDVESGFTASQIHTYPQRALRIGQKNAFYVLMKTRKSDIEYECPMGESGYRVILHFPSCYPDVTENHFTVPLGQSVTGVIIPHMIKTSEGVKRFHPQTRDCYFQSERPLKYFKVYTQANCLLECKTNYTLDICGCVGFHMPRSETIECIKSVRQDQLPPFRRKVLAIWQRCYR
ncbi:unnamed protein product [Acanthoscelides obtectus]|uniref:Uncharacterized protein n=1 Tax=Acanthoscelides obtectus TaxID=200917 RepID=A0A9P0NWF4_ACAOB|nr:unnamed protein product [Acanthoscelides obtectus]CAK1663756.1 Pickpocket protein 11 [Acanthoscelides obtectus]